MSRSRTVLIVISVVLALTAVVVGTLAFLSDDEKIRNTFTVGNVDITLDEAKVDENGVAVTPSERIPNDNDGGFINNYRLSPGRAYLKDPTVTVLGGSEDSYLRVIITVTVGDKVDAIVNAHSADGLEYGDFVRYDDGNAETVDESLGEKWELLGGAPTLRDGVLTFEIRYTEVFRSVDTDTELVVFNRLVIPDYVNNTELSTLVGMEMEIEAHAIQAEGFANANEAWEAFEEQMSEATSGAGTGG